MESNAPYTVLHQERCGRLLVAGRSFLAGEEIFCDSPAAMGPDNNPRPVCLVCYTRLRGRTVVPCRGCGWPLCSDQCRDSVAFHARECHLFQIHNTRFNIDDHKATCPSYNAIMVLRLLWLRHNDPTIWEMIDILMDHLEEDKKLTETERTVVDFIRVHCKLNQFSEEEILHIMGIVDTNSYIIGENPDKNVDLQGLFPVTSIINHSCTANTICFAREDFSFVCRAVTDIQEGEELTTNYLYHQYHFYGLSYRAEELEDFWHFTCNCYRCQDMTELGTMSDSILCATCGSGLLIPGTLSSYWVCSKCDMRSSTREVSNRINHWWNVIQEADVSNIALCMDLLDQMGGIFHKNHYYVMEVKRRLIENIRNAEGFESEDSAISWLEKKVEYCKEHLSLQQRLAPGLSEYRAYVSSLMAGALYWLAKKQFSISQVTREQVVKTMKTVSEHLVIVISIWGPYRRGSNERMVADEAQALLEKVEREFVQDLKERQRRTYEL